jgi:hypothetical protein
MVTCALCKIQETQLYENGTPICLKCADSRKPSTPSVQALLMRDLHEATLRGDSGEGDRRFRRERGHYSGMIPVSRRSDATLVL